MTQATFAAIQARNRSFHDPHERPSGGRLHRGLLAIIALGVSGAARADLPDPFNTTLYGTNFFNWIDFDAADTAVSQPALATTERPANTVIGYAGEQITHDDNVYHLPAPQITPVNSAQYSRADTIDTISVGADGRFGVSQQYVEVLARLDDNLYFRNPHLDNIGESLQALGNWAVGRRWSGQVGAGYDQWLGQFGNYVQFGPNFGLPKNISTTRKLLASSEFWLGYHWVIRANGLQRSTSYTENRFDIFTGDTASLGVEYYAAGGTVIGASFTDTNGHYQLPAVVNGISFDRNFQERTSTVQFQTPIGTRLELHGDVGYVSHEYPAAPAYNFKGGTWDLALSVQTSAKTQLLLTGSRHLYEHIDADSEYYESEQLRAIARWAPTSKLTVDLSVWREKQDFIGPNPDSATLILPKHNTLRYREASFAWSISRALQVVISYNYDARESNVPQLTYDENLVSATLRGRF